MLYPDNVAVKNGINAINNHYYSGYPEDKIHSLVMFSGGLDSVALLANMLQHTKHKVHAHFVEIVNQEKRAAAEKVAVEKCVNYLMRNYRPFEFSTSVYEMMLGEPKWVGPDVSAVMFMAARLCKSIGNTIDMVWTGHLRGPIYEYIDAGAVHAASYVGLLKQPIWVMPVLNFLKFDLYESIPKELAEMTWSCRYPIYVQGMPPKQCGTCHACEAHNRVRNLAEHYRMHGLPPQRYHEYDPTLTYEEAAAKWYCHYPRHDDAKNVFRCGMCKHCELLLRLQHEIKARSRH